MLYEETKTLEQKKACLTGFLERMIQDDIEKINRCTNQKQTDIMFESIMIGINAQIEYYNEKLWELDNEKE